jgi:hypothetical protein
MRPSLWRGMMMGGRLVGGNSAGIATRTWSKGELREDDPDRWAPSVSDGGAVTGGRPARARRWAMAL